MFGFRVLVLVTDMLHYALTPPVHAAKGEEEERPSRAREKEYTYDAPSPALVCAGNYKKRCYKMGQALQAISRALSVSFGTPVLRLEHRRLTPNQPNQPLP